MLCTCELADRKSSAIQREASAYSSDANPKAIASRAKSVFCFHCAMICGMSCTAVDTSVPSDNMKKADSKADDESADSSSSDAAPADQSDNPDAVPAPAAKKAQVDSQ